MENIRDLIEQIRKAQDDERKMSEEVAYLEAKAESVGAIPYDKTGSRTKQTKGPVEEVSIRLAEARERQSNMNRDHYKLRLEAAKRFWEIDDKSAAFIMDRHYAQGMSLREVSVSIGMSKEFVKKKCREGIHAVFTKELKKLGACTQDAQQL